MQSESNWTSVLLLLSRLIETRCSPAIESWFLTWPISGFLFIYFLPFKCRNYPVMVFELVTSEASGFLIIFESCLSYTLNGMGATKNLVKPCLTCLEVVYMRQMHCQKSTKMRRNKQSWTDTHWDEAGKIFDELWKAGRCQFILFRNSL